MKYAFIAGALCQSGDRFLRSGYKAETLSLETVLDEMGKRHEAGGVEIHYRGADLDLGGLRDRLFQTGLLPAAVNTWTYGDRKWRYGSLSAADDRIRRAAVEHCKACIDAARFLGAGCVGLWLGQDGHEYVFQIDYRAQGVALRQSLRELCDYAPDLCLALEPKAREPRNHSLVDCVQTVLLLRMEVERENLGVALDAGHVICAGGAIGPAIELAMRYGCLYDVHMNDNLGTWDDDMIVGSVRLNEMLEALYLLRRYDYRGYLTVDIFPYREDPFDAVCESIRALRTYESIIERLGMETIDALVARANVPDTLAALRRAAFHTR